MEALDRDDASDVDAVVRSVMYHYATKDRSASKSKEQEKVHSESTFGLTTLSYIDAFINFTTTTEFDVCISCVLHFLQPLQEATWCR